MKSPDRHSTRGKSGASYTMTILEAVAEAEGVDVAEVRPPLGDVIDPDALGKLLCHSDTSTQVTFRYDGWKVDIHADGAVTVTEPPNDT